MLTITEIVNCVSDQIQSGVFELVLDEPKITEAMISILNENDFISIASDADTVDELVDESREKADIEMNGDWAGDLIGIW